MPKLIKHENYKVAVSIDGSLFISTNEGILYEYTEDKEVLLYIKSKDGNKEIKVKITKD